MHINKFGNSTNKLETMIRTITFCAFILFSICSVYGQEVTQWRGENSEAKYRADQLLEKWPETGPTVLWTFEKLGKGYSSPVFANGKIYCSGMLEDQGVLFVFNEDGSLEKELNYGKEWDLNYHGTRSAPTIVGELAYIYSGEGQIVCLNLVTGGKEWTKGLTDFDAENLRFGVTESLIVDGNKVYYTPGGKTNNVLALNRFNGETIWTSPAEGEKSAYCTPKLVEYPSRKLFVTHTANHIIGLDTEDGKMLWSYPHTNQHSIHPNSVIFNEDALFCFSGYGQGAVKLNLSNDGANIAKAWDTKLLDNQMGGAMIVDGFVYGSGHKARGWYCLDWQTGKEKFKNTELGNGVIIMAGNKFIIYSDRGELVLVNPNTEKLDIISKTKVAFGSAQHWAHPVVHNGVLYVRHGNALVAYQISK